MAIKYLHFMIEKYIDPIDKKTKYELSHWYYASELPYVAMRQHLGFYLKYEDADNAHHRQVLIDKFPCENEEDNQAR